MPVLDILQTVFTVLATIAATIASIYAYRLQKLRIQFEENAKNIQEKQSHILREMSEFSTAIMNQTLRVAPQFAFSPYQQLLPSITSTDISLFDRRRSHFSPEKDLLADVVVRIIGNQIDKDKNLFIILILDAGSTVYPVFRRLCLHPSFQFDRTKARRVKIITNNLPGVSDLVRYGRIGDAAVARTLFQCQILSGFAHSQYEACLSPETAIDLRRAINEHKETLSKEESHPTQIKVISITTGNYISIIDGMLARDRDHLETKSTMLEVADDVYVLAPLGKLLPYSCFEINELLELSEDTGYVSLPKWSERMQDLNMVVTTRQPDYFPQLHPRTLNTYFGHVQGEVRDKYRNHLIRVPFDPMDDVRVRSIASVSGLERALREYELPHQNLREKLLVKLQNV
jgi:hypothetical protein